MAWPATSTTMTPGSTLNLRSSPSTGAQVLGSIPNGGTISITGPAVNGWFPVVYNGRTGYASAQYIKPPATSTTPTTPTTGGTWPQSSTANTPGSTLNFRAGPSTSSGILGSIPHGGTISLTGAAVNGWYPATFNGRAGYVSAQYVNAPTPSTPPTTPPTTPPVTPPPNIPHTPNNPNTPAGSNPFYSPGSTYGSHQNWWDTPLITQSQDFGTEYEKFITDSGYGGLNQKGNFARNLIDRARSGFTAATANNPNLTARNYLNTSLGSKFLDTVRAGMTPTQKGEQHGIMAPRSRWIDR
jgi:uncharacterized protein YraI